MTAISVVMSGSTAQPIVAMLWNSALFLVWGAALQEVYTRLTPAPALLETSAGQTGLVEVIDRRQFLVRLGAAN